ncbi:MAG TPA: TRAM domain-containing protein [Nocardioidaceae bacterium]|nr:TRAM domain-containing protein [Nocardioidaceae bacterium]
MTRRRGPAEAVDRGPSLVGQEYQVEVGPVAHGGHLVARYEGRVLFVRHALPGERVTVRVTEGQERSRFLRADAVRVHEASPDRVEPPCPYAGPGRCGGCDFQHVAVPAQRELKAAVVREQLQRLAGLDLPVTVEAVPAVPGQGDGLGWRTRVQYAVDPDDGRPGLRRHRSHEVVAVDRCRIAHPDLPPVTDRTWPDAAYVEAIVSSTGERLRLVQAVGSRSIEAEGPEVLHESAAGRDWQVSGSGFWQVHPVAADTLADAVAQCAQARHGERALDLYSGVGLFSAGLAREVGLDGEVVSVESDAVAVADAAVNLAGLPQVTLLRDRVDRALSRGRCGDRADVVVLDPPRTGARAAVVRAIAALAPRVVVYVACDPAALARDVAGFAELGYNLDGLRAFDLFPMTHHVECVAVLTRG